MIDIRAFRAFWLAYIVLFGAVIALFFCNHSRGASALLFCERATTLDTAIICGLISAASAIIVSVITAVYNNKLIVYRLEQLEKKMDGNAELTKRVVVLETKVEALENDGK